jgi:type II secretion system protein C
MKSPLWIVSSLLALILLVLLAYIVYSTRTIFVRPQTASIKVGPIGEVGKKVEPKPKDLQLIYEEHDLFGTFRPSIMPMKPIDLLPNIPQPPQHKPILRRPRAPIQFLEPLPVKITGIIASSNDAKSQVTIMNNNTRKTESFKIGDKIIDAYIIKIFPRKIVVVRSNGQQETLFLYPADAQEEIKTLKDASWSEVIQRQNAESFLVNPTTFVSRIPSLAQFIDLLDLTIASKNGRVTGLRVGKMDNKSIGFVAGLMPGDLLVKINNLAPTTTKNRMRIYNDIASLELGSEIKTQVMRKGQLVTLKYKLVNLANPEAEESSMIFAPPIQQPAPVPHIPQMPAAPMALPEPRKEGPPQSMAQEIQTRDMNAMNQFGSRSARITEPEPVGITS